MVSLRRHGSSSAARSIAVSVLALFSVVVALATAGAFAGREPLFELLTHFRLQYVLVSALCLVGLLFLRRFATAALALACLLLNCVYVLPFYASGVPTATAGQAGDRIRLMLANVYLANHDYAALLEVVRVERPDMLVLEEVTGPWWRNIGELRRDFPYYNAIPRKGGSGIAFFSKLPLDEVEVLTFDASTQPGMLARVRVGDRRVSVLMLHPPTPVRAAKFRYRNDQFRAAAQIMRSIVGPRVLIGDLNTSPWSPYFEDLVHDSGLRDARRGAGLWTTWPVPLPSFLRIPIDHCLTSDDIHVDAIRTGAYTGSDHRPIVVDVTVRR